MLSVILGNTELAMEGLDPAERRRADLLEVQNAARRAADLTRQLLAFARKQTVAPKVIDLNDSLADMVSMLRCLLGTNIELAFLPAAGLWPVKIDPSQVDQILTNLCVNAREAIRDAGRLTIGTANLVLTEASSKRYADADPGDYAVLTVSDTGCGMSKETLRHVFEPFFTTKYRRGGTGLGLATVYGIVKQNRGFIDVSSEPGRGTTFKIGFPHHPDDTPEPGPSSVSEAKPIRGTGSILLVEDDEALLDMTETMLEKLGYTVTAANSPQDALRLAGQSGGAFDLMITDIIMPGMNGFELARKLRLDFPKMKHLFMSGYTDSLTVHQDILDAGGHFIQKPFTLQDLSAKVWRALDNR
jgi:CheY-like chemotaxis protein